MSASKKISILGSTGSIGTQCLEVARWQGYRVEALAAGTNTALLLEQVHNFRPAFVSCAEECQAQLRQVLPSHTTLLPIEELAQQDCDVLVAAIPGFVGLAPTLAALEVGHKVALANKESMVVAGPLVWETARKHGASIIPVDSEHSALFQCLVGEDVAQVESLVLTASGGPFREQPLDLSEVTPEQALKHPNWTMGAKVTIDSSTLFNKGLEVLEAHYLFEIPLPQIEVVIHPQSLVHSMVRFQDGNIKAQIGPHDMRLPIQYAIEYPQRPKIPLQALPLKGSWDFYEPDLQRFPALKLAYQAGEAAGTAPAVLNAADEVAVEAFLSKRMGYGDIARVLEHCLNTCPQEALSWQAIHKADALSRQEALRYIAQL